MGRVWKYQAENITWSWEYQAENIIQHKEWGLFWRPGWYVEEDYYDFLFLYDIKNYVVLSMYFLFYNGYCKKLALAFGRSHLPKRGEHLTSWKRVLAVIVSQTRCGSITSTFPEDTGRRGEESSPTTSTTTYSRRTEEVVPRGQRCYWTPCVASTYSRRILWLFWEEKKRKKKTGPRKGTSLHRRELIPVN